MKPQPPAMQWGLFLFSVTGVLLSTQSASASTVNVALKGVATQSSQYDDYGAAPNAIDGNRDTDYSSGSCSCNAYESDPWWRVDLLDVYRVAAVSVTNRGWLPERLDGAEILIGDSLENNGNNNPRCAFISHIPAGQTSTFQCNNMEGRYVSVAILGRIGRLTMCEVEVFGTLADSEAATTTTAEPSTVQTSTEHSTTSTVGPSTVQTSTEHSTTEHQISENITPGSQTKDKLVLVNMRKTWSEAQDYCRDRDMDLVSVHNDTIQDWVEARVKMASTPHVWLGLRYACNLGFWFWVTGSSCYTNWAPGNGTGREGCGRTGAIERGGEHRWVSRPESEKLHFICSSSDEY